MKAMICCRKLSIEFDFKINYQLNFECMKRYCEKIRVCRTKNKKKTFYSFLNLLTIDIVSHQKR